MIKRVTNGELRTAKECRRKWWLSWYRRRRFNRESVTTPAALGTRVHKAMQAMYSPTPSDPLVALEAAIEADRLLLEDDPDEIRPFENDAEMARIMVRGYIEWLAETGADQGLSIIGAEMPMEVPFDYASTAWESVTLIGKVDVRVRREIDGARLFIDHKTVGSIPDASRRLHMDEQMLQYDLIQFLQALAEGRVDPSQPRPVTDGALYNMLRKVKRTVKANPPFYSRVEVRHNVHELRSYWKRVFETVRLIEEMTIRLDRGDDPLTVAIPNPTKDCSWKCEFFSVCTMFDDGSDAEGMLDAYWVEADPLDRYQEQEINHAP